MNIPDLKTTWQRQKEYHCHELISEEDIMQIVRRELDGQAKAKRMLYNMSSFVFLLTFCQTC